MKMLPFLLVLLCLLRPILAAPITAPPNLLANPGFEAEAAPNGKPPGWAAFWARTPGSGAMTLDAQVVHAGKNSLKITHTGAEDWSAAQEGQIAVKPGDIFRIQAWVKSENTNDLQISVVTRRANGETQDWTFGRIDAGGTHDWQEFSRRFVVPADCATIQFRVIGNGLAAAWVDDVALVLEGNTSAFGAKLRNKTLHIANTLLDVTLNAPTGLLSVADRRNSHRWRQTPFREGLIVKDAWQISPLALRLSVWDVLNGLTLTADFALDPKLPELRVTLAGNGPVQEPVAFPAPFATQKGDRLVVPLNEGILFPVDDLGVYPMSLVTYSGHGLCMAWVGVTDAQNGAGMMTIVQTPDDARVELARLPGGLLIAQPEWDATRGKFGYNRALAYVFFAKGGYVAQAKRYRAYAQKIGLFKTLAQKRQENPNVDRLVGAVNVWNWDMDKIALCREFKTLGWSHVLWSSGGSPTEIAQIAALGYLPSRYDIYQDVWPPDAPLGRAGNGWPEDLVWLPNGDWMKGWADIRHNADGTQTTFQGGVICSPRGLLRAQREIPADLKTHPYLCRFIDTTTASPWRECYNPAHPLTRSQDRKYKMALLDFCAKDMKQVVGTETGIDASVPYADYYEGMMSLGPYRLPNAGYETMAYKTPTPDFLKFQVGHFYRIPLWELVYHDCTVAQWYWGDSSNKAPEVWDQRDLFNILYGTPPLFMFDRSRWEKDRARFIQSYSNVCPIVRRLGYDEMTAHDFLTPDHAVQRTHWRSGTEIVVNFGQTPQTLPDGRIIKPMGWLVRERKPVKK